MLNAPQKITRIMWNIDGTCDCRKGEKYNKTAQDSSSTAMRSNSDILRSITERLGNTRRIGNVECTPPVFSITKCL